MDKKKRPLLGVIAADAADMEQRELLSGIIEQAQAQNMDVAVLSNIYNPIESSPVLKRENCIYERIASPQFDGFLLISESIINAELQNIILEQLRRRTDVPVVVLGTPLPELTLPQFRYLNTSDEDDLADITDHLIEVHGYTDIAILSGHEHLEVSHKRVAGYRRSLERHGIAYDEKKIWFGDYWMTSGRDYARRFLSGELPCPQALICCNDYMAYGILDEFMEQGIPLTEKMALIGYEYVRERHAHTPLLSTYQRNRKALGAAAVRLLTGQQTDITPAHGRIIPGETCGCHGKFEDMRREMTAIQTKETYEFLNLFSQLEHRLTECRNISEFAATCREFPFMIRNADRLYLCLYENWYDNSPHSENMVRYDLRDPAEPVIFHKDHISNFLAGEPAPYYLCPLFFADRELGYIVLRYSESDTFDHIFRNWLKSIANGLELLRMKNDIRYLAACQNLSEQHDSLTAMLNRKGLKQAFRQTEQEGLYLVALQICLFETDFSATKTHEKIAAILDAAEAVRQFCGDAPCARTPQNLFLCLIRSEAEADFVARLLTDILCQHTAYMMQYGMDSFVCTAQLCDERSFAEVTAACETALQAELDILSARRRDKHYAEMLSLRNRIYQNPNATFDTEKLREHFSGSAGHLRNLYRQCFGISFHQDCIAARVAKAKYLLTVNGCTVQETAFRCGYSDSKYFMRQFAQETEVTAKRFRGVWG